MKVWLDDERPAPNGWVHVKTPWEAIELLKTNTVQVISLDNDLGLFNYEPPNEGRHVADWIEEQAVLGNLSRLVPMVHTHNQVAKVAMKAALRRAMEAWQAQKSQE